VAAPGECAVEAILGDLAEGSGDGADGVAEPHGGKVVRLPQRRRRSHARRSDACAARGASSLSGMMLPAPWACREHLNVARSLPDPVWIACGEWARLATHREWGLHPAPCRDFSAWAPAWFVPVSTGSLPESGLRAGGSHDGHRYERTTKTSKLQTKDGPARPGSWRGTWPPGRRFLSYLAASRQASSTYKSSSTYKYRDGRHPGRRVRQPSRRRGSPRRRLRHRNPAAARGLTRLSIYRS